MLAVFGSIGAGFVAFSENVWVPGVSPARSSCSIIQGSEYESISERVWYFANCVHGSTSEVVVVAAIVGVVLCALIGIGVYVSEPQDT